MLYLLEALSRLCSILPVLPQTCKQSNPPCPQNILADSSTCLSSLQLHISLVDMASAKMTSADNATDSPGEKVTVNQMDPLALVIEQVSHAQRVARQTPVASSRDEADSIFLCGFASQDSFVGSLEVEEGMTDDAIEDFVRQNNPDMFVRLFVTDDMTARIFEMTRDNGVADGGASMTALEYGVANPGYNDSTCGGMAKQIDLQQLLLHIKKLLISSLLSEYPLWYCSCH